MSYLQKMLLPDERLLYVATIHWVVFIPGVLLTVIGGVLGASSYGLAGYLLGSESSFNPYVGHLLAGVSLVMAFLGLILLTGALIRQSSTELAITNRRIIAKYGFISRATFEMLMDRVTGANFDQTITGRLMGYGTILVHGMGGDVSPFELISNPQLFQRTLMDQLERYRRR